MLTQMTVLRSEKQEEWDRRDLAQLKEELQVLRYMCRQRLLVLVHEYKYWRTSTRVQILAQLKEELQVLRYLCVGSACYVCVRSTTYISVPQRARAAKGGAAGAALYMCRQQQCLLHMCRQYHIYRVAQPEAGGAAGTAS
jgi:hypothetical protein